MSSARDEMTLWGEPAEILRHLLEIRGVGIIDVMSLYGSQCCEGFFTGSNRCLLGKLHQGTKPTIVLVIMWKKLNSVE